MADAVKKEMDSLEKDLLRGRQGDAFNCSAKCCQDKYGSAGDVQRCIENCMAPLQQAEQVIGQEMNRFQDRYYRCAKTCEDNVRDMAAGKSKQSPEELMKAMEPCFVGCVDDFIKVLPKTMKNVRKELEKTL